MEETLGHEPVSLEEMPENDLFLSQVINFLNEHFPEERFTSNIIQNYIKSEVITKPFHGKKRGYSRMHLIQLVFLCYMRPILTTDEIRKVFALAFNEINKPEDDIISWEEAYEMFLAIYEVTRNGDDLPTNWAESEIDGYIDALKINKDSYEQIRQFIQVLILVARATDLKRRAQTIISQGV